MNRFCGIRENYKKNNVKGRFEEKRKTKNDFRRTFRD